MKKAIKIFIGVVIILVATFFVYGVYVIRHTEKTRIESETNKQTHFDTGNYDVLLQNNMEEFNNVSLKFSKENIPNFCNQGQSKYTIDGDEYDLKNNSFFESRTMGGYSRSFDELLSSDHVTRENFEYYKNFLDKFDFVHCISFDPNFKANKNSLPLFAIKYEVTAYDGYIYISDGSVTDHVYEEYKDKTFLKLDRISTTNWYKFKYRNKFGI